MVLFKVEWNVFVGDRWKRNRQWFRRESEANKFAESVRDLAERSGDDPELSISRNEVPTERKEPFIEWLNAYSPASI